MEQTTIKDQLAAGNPVATQTSGVSMEPLLYDHDTCVIIVRPDHELVPGELPIYLRPDGIYVIHRVIKTDEKYYYTRGDNCINHEKIPKEWVLGVVIEIIRKGKHIRVTDRNYQAYVMIWNRIYPLRLAYYRLRGLARRIWIRLKKKV